ncbi:hypothetical protein [Dyadobacter sp. 3J3]|uniref:hypothetical protein n=1 Tax=Dyadobacter sp. 3J3 TaxID=2606600 RepID=UPI00135A51DC|nr:hypothetical protein [Dyadobacter sp. 3J3]
MNDEFPESESRRADLWAGKMILYAFLIACGLLGGGALYSEFVNSDDSGIVSDNNSTETLEGLSPEYLGAYSGIQPSYGAYVNERVTSTTIGIAPESVFTFCFRSDNIVLLQRHMVMSEGPEEYVCKGTYEILEKSSGRTRVKCSMDCLTYGRDVSYILNIRTGGKSATFEDPSESKAPNFKLDKLKFPCE